MESQYYHNFLIFLTQNIKVKKNINTWKGDIEVLQEFIDDTNIIEQCSKFEK